jgi:hypothetical protein
MTKSNIHIEHTYESFASNRNTAEPIPPSLRQGDCEAFSDVAFAHVVVEDPLLEGRGSIASGSGEDAADSDPHLDRPCSSSSSTSGPLLVPAQNLGQPVLARDSSRSMLTSCRNDLEPGGTLSGEVHSRSEALCHVAYGEGTRRTYPPGAIVSNNPGKMPMGTSKFEHVRTDDGHYVDVGAHGRLKRCEDEPITIPGAVQGFGVLMVVEQDSLAGYLTVRQVSEVRVFFVCYTESTHSDRMPLSYLACRLRISSNLNA